MKRLVGLICIVVAVVLRLACVGQALPILLVLIKSHTPTIHSTLSEPMFTTSQWTLWTSISSGHHRRVNVLVLAQEHHGIQIIEKNTLI